MSDLFTGLLGAAAQIGGQAATPAPSQASRGNDFNPVISINNVAPPDFSQLTGLFNAINSGVNTEAATFSGNPVPATIASITDPITGIFNNLPLIALIGAGIIVYLIWKKHV